MATPSKVRHKHTHVPGKAPLPGDFDQDSEILLNLAEGNMFVLTPDGVKKFRNSDEDDSRFVNSVEFNEHAHEWDEIEDKPNAFPPETHNHDDRYFTETEILRRFGGAQSTSGVHDWNDETNTQPGIGPTLLLGSHTNGPGDGQYYFVWNIEYGPKQDGTGQITQLAMPYTNQSSVNGGPFWYRGRYQGTWTNWERTFSTVRPPQISDVPGLQSALNAKASAAQGALADTAVQPTRTITAGTGMTGGGSLAGNITISLGPSSIASLLRADTALQAADITGKEEKANKNVAGGYAGLDAAGKLDESHLPAIAIIDTHTVASQAAMLALVAQKGDVAVRSDLNKSFILQASPATTLANWIELRTPTDAVLSVAGQTGAISQAALRTALGLGTAAYAATGTFASVDHAHATATASMDGFMPKGDKSKIDAIAAGANVTNAATVGAALAGVSQKDTPADGDRFSGVLSGGSSLFWTTWGNIKAAIKASLTKDDVGLDKVDNTPDGTKTVHSFRVTDTRDVVSQPNHVMDHGGLFEFKANSSVGNPPSSATVTYAHILSVNGWKSDGTGGWPTQMSFGESLAFRKGATATTWGAWREIWDSGNLDPVRRGGTEGLGGFTSAGHNLGNLSGTVTPNPLNGNFQYGSKSGTLVIAAPANGHYNMSITVTNSSGTGTFTATGFNLVEGEFAITSGAVHRLYIDVSGSNKLLTIRKATA